MADDVVTLALPPGIDGYPISHGDRSFPYYRPDPDGPFLVDVPQRRPELRGSIDATVDSTFRLDHTRLSHSRRVSGTASVGHEDAFPPHRPNAGYVIGKETVAGRAEVGEMRRLQPFLVASVQRGSTRI
jgi:hypothetical protein